MSNAEDGWLLNHYDVFLNLTHRSQVGHYPVTPDMWALGQPDNRRGDEFCVALNACQDCVFAGLHDVSCSVNLNIVCQVSAPRFKII